MRFILVVSVLFFLSTVQSFDDHEISKLPGLDWTLKFKQYAGHLDAGKGRHLFYWFVESETNPTEDPVILWMNGGPGCSSMAGNLMELGPFRVNKTNSQQLLPNNFAWNKRANVIFLEAPAGVGFSYKDDGDLDTDDDLTADGNHQALISFFKRYPQFKKNPFFITGESYAGIYVPTLTKRVLDAPDDSEKINLQGYAIGNGFMDQEFEDNSLPVYGYSHGLVGEKDWENLIESCCTSSERNPFGCSFYKNRSPKCRTAFSKASGAAFNDRLNPYNIYKECEQPKKQGYSRIEAAIEMLNYQVVNVSGMIVDSSLAFQKKFTMVTPPCVDDTYVKEYLNNPLVRKALHVPDKVIEWEICSDVLSGRYHSTYTSVREIIKYFAKKGLKGMVYNGDIDMMCNVLNNEWFVESLGLETVSPFKWWAHDGQMAGKIKYFDNLIFTTVRGAGHMVPEDKPSQALAMLDNFLKWALN